MKKQQILILGGTGKTGRKVAERLIKRDEPIRIGSRRQVPPFDWEKPDTWSGALDGITKVYITFQPDLAAPGAQDTIERFTSQAAENEIQKMVLLSGRGEKKARLCETIVKNAGTDWTIVRADWFSQNFSEGFFLDSILGGHLALPKGDVKIPFVDTGDIADVVVESLLHDKHNGKTHELTGPRLLTFEQTVKTISEASGRDITYQSIAMDEYKAMLIEHHVPENYIWLLTYLFTEVLDGRNSSITNDVEKILERKAKDFAAYTRETTKTGIWNVN